MEKKPDKKTTRTQELETIIKEYKAKYQTLLEFLPVGVYSTSRDGRIIDANQAAATLLGHKTVDDIININVNDFYVNKEDRIQHLKNLEKEGTFPAEFELRRKGGKTIWVRDYCHAVKNPEGKIETLEGILVDITERKSADEKLQKVLNELQRSNEERRRMIKRLQILSIMDDLTGLYNRRGFFTLSAQQIEIAKRKNADMFLLFVDLDDMKWINDTMGHHKGDEALIAVANIINQTFRKSDIKARIGGDEFAILALETSYRRAENLIERLQKGLEKYNATKTQFFRLAVSTGITWFDAKNPCSIEELFVRADKLMYEQKRRKSL